MKPRIAIPVPNSKRRDYVLRALPQYEQAVRAAGGEPVVIDVKGTNSEIAQAVKRCDGVLLPGSPADVDPEKYGAQRHPKTAAVGRPSRQRGRAAASGRLQHAQAGLRHLLWAAVAERLADGHARPGRPRGREARGGAQRCPGASGAEWSRSRSWRRFCAMRARCLRATSCSAGKLQPSSGAGGAR